MAKIEIEFESDHDTAIWFADVLMEIPWFPCVDSGYSAKMITDDGEEVQIYENGEQVHEFY